MSEQTLVFQTPAPADAAEICLIAELTDCYQARLAMQDAISRPQQIILQDEYKALVKAAQLAQAKLETAKVKLRTHTPSHAQDGP